jgi:hypothetical protein
MPEPHPDERPSRDHPVLFQVGAWSLVAGILATAVLAWLLRGITPWSGAPILLGLVVFIGTAFAASALDQSKRNREEPE